MALDPAALQGSGELPDGRRVFWRALRADDGPLLQDLLDHMSEEDRRLRFFAPIRRLPEALVRRLTEVDYERTVALAACDEAGTLLGVVRLAAEPDKSGAEFAVALRSDWKGRGLGWLLMHRMTAIAAQLGVAEVFGWVLRGNETMLEMSREMGFTIEAVPGDPEVLRVRCRVTAPPRSS